MSASLKPLAVVALVFFWTVPVAGEEICSGIAEREKRVACLREAADYYLDHVEAAWARMLREQDEKLLPRLRATREAWTADMERRCRISDDHVDEDEARLRCAAETARKCLNELRLLYVMLPDVKRRLRAGWLPCAIRR